MLLIAGGAPRENVNGLKTAKVDRSTPKAAGLLLVRPAANAIAPPTAMLAAMASVIL